MYIQLKNTTKNNIEKIEKFLDKNNIKYYSTNEQDTFKCAILYLPHNFSHEKFEEISEFATVKKISKSYKFSSREFKNSDTIIEIKGQKIGGNNFAVMAGPCSVENKEMLERISEKVASSGATILRGGAFKPRTSPYDFQGLGEKGLKYLREMADRNNMLVVTELMDTENLELVSKYADIVQVGARNMQNFSLLKKLGKIKNPILLKRGLSATISEFLMSAEYIIAHGNPNVILCERGIRTFETMTRNTVDINAIAVIKKESHLPIIIDASHGTGKRELVIPITLAGIIAGADGAMVEVHENPECALSDGPQSLNFKLFDEFMSKVKKTVEFKKNL